MLTAAKVVAPAVTATSISLYYRFEPNEHATTQPIRASSEKEWLEEF